MEKTFHVKFDRLYKLDENFDEVKSPNQIRFFKNQLLSLFCFIPYHSISTSAVD